MEFDWDKEKAELNIKKYGVGFDEAVTVFDELFNIDFYDPKHSFEEHRFLIVGESNLQRFLMVSYTERIVKIRLIRAVQLTPQERRNYEN